MRSRWKTRRTPAGPTASRAMWTARARSGCVEGDGSLLLRVAARGARRERLKPDGTRQRAPVCSIARTCRLSARRLQGTPGDPMAKRYRDSYAAAEDAFTSEGGHIADRMDAGPMRPGETLLERATLMATFAIRYNGTHYSCQGVRFLHLTDAVNHARLVLVREADRVRQRDATTHPGIDAPDEAERKTMS